MARKDKTMKTNLQCACKIRAIVVVIAAFGLIAPVRAQITNPAPGTVLNSSTVTFTWNALSGASAYYLGVGTTGQGSSNIFNRNVGLGTSQTVPGIPLGRGAIYVTLAVAQGPPPFTYWAYHYYTYATAGSAAVMTSPAPGVCTGLPATFTWSLGSGASEYWLSVGTSLGASDIFSYKEGLATSQTVYDYHLITTFTYVRLYTLLGGGVWVYNDYTYLPCL
jgi:hypothetical protein